MWNIKVPAYMKFKGMRFHCGDLSGILELHRNWTPALFIDVCASFQCITFLVYFLFCVGMESLTLYVQFHYHEGMS